MVYLILLFFIFIILILLFFIKKLKNNIQILSDTLVKTNKILSEEKQKDKQIIFWVIDKYTDKDINFLKWNKQTLNIILKIIIFYIAYKTDLMRSKDKDISIDNKIWQVDQLHELYNFFYKLTLDNEEEQK